MSVKIISRTALENARQRLRELPKLEPKQRDKFTVTEALKDLGPEIREVMKKGYTLAQIHEQLQVLGVGIALNTLRKAKLRPARRKAAPAVEEIVKPKAVGKPAPASVPETQTTPRTAAAKLRQEPQDHRSTSGAYQRDNTR